MADTAFAHLAASVQWHSAPMPAEEATDLQRLPATTRLVALRGGDETLFDAALPPAVSSSEAIPHESASPLRPPSGTNAALVGTPEEYIKALGNASIRVLTMKPGDVLEF